MSACAHAGLPMQPMLDGTTLWAEQDARLWAAFAAMVIDYPRRGWRYRHFELVGSTRKIAECNAIDGTNSVVDVRASAALLDARIGQLRWYDLFQLYSRIPFSVLQCVIGLSIVGVPVEQQNRYAVTEKEDEIVQTAIDEMPVADRQSFVELSRPVDAVRPTESSVDKLRRLSTRTKSYYRPARLRWTPSRRLLTSVCHRHRSSRPPASSTRSPPPRLPRHPPLHRILQCSASHFEPCRRHRPILKSKRPDCNALSQNFWVWTPAASTCHGDTRLTRQPKKNLLLMQRMPWRFRPDVRTFTGPVASFLTALEHEIDASLELQHAFKEEQDLTFPRILRLISSEGTGKRASAIQRAKAQVSDLETLPTYRAIRKYVRNTCKSSTAPSLSLCTNILQKRVCEMPSSVRKSLQSIGVNSTIQEIVFPSYRSAARAPALDIPAARSPARAHESFGIAVHEENQSLEKAVGDLEDEENAKESADTHRGGLVQKDEPQFWQAAAIKYDPAIITDLTSEFQIGERRSLSAINRTDTDYTTTRLNGIVKSGDKFFQLTEFKHDVQHWKCVQNVGQVELEDAQLLDKLRNSTLQKGEYRTLHRDRPNNWMEGDFLQSGPAFYCLDAITASEQKWTRRSPIKPTSPAQLKTLVDETPLKNEEMRVIKTDLIEYDKYPEAGDIVKSNDKFFLLGSATPDSQTWIATNPNFIVTENDNLDNRINNKKLASGEVKSVNLGALFKTELYIGDIVQLSDDTMLTIVSSPAGNDSFSQNPLNSVNTEINKLLNVPIEKIEAGKCEIRNDASTKTKLNFTTIKIGFDDLDTIPELSRNKKHVTSSKVLQLKESVKDLRELQQNFSSQAKEIQQLSDIYQKISESQESIISALQKLINKNYDKMTKQNEKNEESMTRFTKIRDAAGRSGQFVDANLEPIFEKFFKVGDPYELTVFFTTNAPPSKKIVGRDIVVAFKASSSGITKFKFVDSASLQKLKHDAVSDHSNLVGDDTLQDGKQFGISKLFKTIKERSVDGINHTFFESDKIETNAKFELRFCYWKDGLNASNKIFDASVLYLHISYPERGKYVFLIQKDEISFYGDKKANYTLKSNNKNDYYLKRALCFIRVIDDDSSNDFIEYTFTMSRQGYGSGYTDYQLRVPRSTIVQTLPTGTETGKNLIQVKEHVKLSHHEFDFLPVAKLFCIPASLVCIDNTTGEFCCADSSIQNSKSFVKECGAPLFKNISDTTDVVVRLQKSGTSIKWENFHSNTYFLEGDKPYIVDVTDSLIDDSFTAANLEGAYKCIAVNEHTAILKLQPPSGTDPLSPYFISVRHTNTLNANLLCYVSENGGKYEFDEKYLVPTERLNMTKFFTKDGSPGSGTATKAPFSHSEDNKFIELDPLCCVTPSMKLVNLPPHKYREYYDSVRADENGKILKNAFGVIVSNDESLFDNIVSDNPATWAPGIFDQESLDTCNYQVEKQATLQLAYQNELKRMLSDMHSRVEQNKHFQEQLVNKKEKELLLTETKKKMQQIQSNETEDSTAVDDSLSTAEMSESAAFDQAQGADADELRAAIENAEESPEAVKNALQKLKETSPTMFQIASAKIREVVRKESTKTTAAKMIDEEKEANKQAYAVTIPIESQRTWTAAINSNPDYMKSPEFQKNVLLESIAQNILKTDLASIRYDSILAPHAASVIRRMYEV